MPAALALEENKEKSVSERINEAKEAPSKNAKDKIEKTEEKNEIT